MADEQSLFDPSDLHLLTPELQARIAAGEITVHPGQRAGKPVLRDVVTRQLIQGGGRAPTAGDPKKASEAAALVSYKRTKNYQEALELLMSVDAPADQRGSYAWFFEQAMKVAEGDPQMVKVPCAHWYPVDKDGEPTDGKPHDEPPCQDTFHMRQVIVQKRDGNLIFKLMELKHGRAKETVEVSGSVGVFVEVLESRETPLMVYDVSPQERVEREDAVTAVLEGQFRDVEDENGE